jgi:hypothetical protein
MRALYLIVWLAVASGCSSYGVRCDRHLHPINIPRPAANAGEVLDGTADGGVSERP